jgi:hypothetical protein
MGGHQPPPTPAGYSTQVGGDYSSGYHTTGYKQVIIDPDTLQSSIDDFRKKLDGQSPRQLVDTLTNALIDPSAFGQIPNASAAYEQVRKFVDDHAAAMSKMGVSLADFVARVQAAAQLGYESDPATKAAAAYARARYGRMLAD